MSAQKCMNYQERQEFVRSLAWRISGDLMQINSLDRAGVLPDLQKEVEKAVKKREADKS